MKSLLRFAIVAAAVCASRAAQQTSHAEVMQLATSKATIASSRALIGFQKYTDNLVDTYMRSGEPIDANTKAAIYTIIDYIYDLHAANLQRHYADVKKVNDCKANMLACDDEWFSDTAREHIANLTVLINRTRDAHVLCRDTQEACCDKLNTAVTHYDPVFTPCSKEPCSSDPPNTIGTEAACDIYDQYRMSDIRALWSDPLEECFHDYKLLDDFLATEEKNKRMEMEECLTHFYDWHKPLYDLYIPCKRGMDCCLDVEKKCIKRQQEFETIHCIGYDYINDHCSGHHKCWKKEEAKCGSTACDEIADNVEYRKAENETGMRIICLLEVLVNSTKEDKREDLDACKNKTYTEEQAFWDITCPAPGFPPDENPDIKKICQGTPVATPCKEAFSLAEYYEHSWPHFPYPYCRFHCPDHYTDNEAKRNDTFVVHKDKSVKEQFGSHTTPKPVIF